MKFVPVDHGRVEAVYVETVGKAVDGVQKVSRDDGRPIWSVRVLLRESGIAGVKPELVEVAVPNLRDLSEVLTPFLPIEFDALKVFPWMMEGRSGLAFSADGCRTKTPVARNGSKSGAVGESPVVAA